MPLGRYWRSRRLVFSLVPRCQGLPGSQNLECARQLLAVASPPDDVLAQPTDVRPPCPHCGGPMIVIETFHHWRQLRAPPDHIVSTELLRHDPPWPDRSQPRCCCASSVDDARLDNGDQRACRQSASYLSHANGRMTTKYPLLRATNAHIAKRPVCSKTGQKPLSP